MDAINFDVTGKFTDTHSYGTRSGFNHETTLITSEGKESHAVAHYINRTWEAYPYQSVKRMAVYNLIDREVNEDCAQYKREKKLARLPRGYRQQCERLYRQKYQSILDDITHNRY